MWFGVKRSVVSLPSIMVNDMSLSPVQKQKYLRITFDTKLNWSYHVANVCRNMSYYLTLVSPHVKSLPSPTYYQNADGIFSFSTLYVPMPYLCGVRPSIRTHCHAYCVFTIGQFA